MRLELHRRRRGVKLEAEGGSYPTNMAHTSCRNSGWPLGGMQLQVLQLHPTRCVSKSADQSPCNERLDSAIPNPKDIRTSHIFQFRQDHSWAKFEQLEKSETFWTVRIGRLSRNSESSLGTATTGVNQKCKKPTWICLFAPNSAVAPTFCLSSWSPATTTRGSLLVHLTLKSFLILRLCWSSRQL